MSDEITFWNRFLPWIGSVVFGAGAGIGGAKITLASHGRRIQDLENWTKNDGLTEKIHGFQCSKAQSDNALATERIINQACEKMSEKILDEVRSLHSRIDHLHNGDHHD